MAQITRLNVQIDAGDDADVEELAELTTQLREQLLELDIERADLVTAGPAPAGTRGGEVVAIGALIVSLASSSGLLTAFVGCVQSWVSRLGRRQVRLEMDGDVLEVTGISSARQDELIRLWIARHSER
ncbi:MAG: effector-associated constant component EACC1 [Egibacteraceae bacterium]